MKIAITGIRTFAGRRVLEALQRHVPQVEIVVIDRGAALESSLTPNRYEIDLTQPSVATELAAIFEAERVDAILHAAFRRLPSAARDRDHALDVEGSRHVLAAATLSGVKRLVVPSTTMVYGAHSAHPSHLREDAPLLGGDLHQVADRIEVETLLAGWQKEHPDAQLTLLRFPWIFGPSYWDFVTRFFSHAMLPTLLGFDPLLQFLHEEDCVRVLVKALLEPHPGCFNIVPVDVLPLSTLLRLAGKRRLALPAALLERIPVFPTEEQTGDAPRVFYEYLRFSWIADGERGWTEFGKPTYTTREAWSAFVSAQRLRASGFATHRA